MNSNLPEKFFKLDYYPSITEEEIKTDRNIKIPFAEIAGLGVAFGSLPEAVRTATQSVNMDKIYKLVNMNSPSYHLQAAKDKQGFLGMIRDEGNHLVRQGRFQKLDSVNEVVTVPFNPSFIFMAAMLVHIEHKLDAIQETQKEILTFLNRDKQTKLEGDLKILVDIINNFKFNWDNETYKKNNHKQAGDIKKEAQQNILFYRRNIIELLNKQKMIFMEPKLKDTMGKLQNHFKYYQLSVYLYAFASFLEVLLLGNYKSDYVKNVASQIEDMSYDYRALYTDSYNKVEQLSGHTVEAVFLGGTALVNKAVGGVISKIPVVEKGPIDEALIGAGEKLEAIGEKNTAERLDLFDDNRDSGVYMFIDNCNTLDVLYNKPKMILLDEDNLYVKEIH